MSDLDFEQRHRLENEVLPAVINDPEYAASTIVRLEAEIERLTMERDNARRLLEAATREGVIGQALADVVRLREVIEEADRLIERYQPVRAMKLLKAALAKKETPKT